MSISMRLRLWSEFEYEQICMSLWSEYEYEFMVRGDQPGVERLPNLPI